MKKLDIIDSVVDLELAKPGLINWSLIRANLLQLGIELDRRVLISRVRAGLRRKQNNYLS